MYVQKSIIRDLMAGVKERALRESRVYRNLYYLANVTSMVGIGMTLERLSNKDFLGTLLETGLALAALQVSKLTHQASKAARQSYDGIDLSDEGLFGKKNVVREK